MATEDEAREAADGTEVQVEAVDLGTVNIQAHPEVKLLSIMDIKNVGEIIDSTEGTLTIPEDQVLVEAPSGVELPPEHNLNGKASSLNGHMDKKEKISNAQPHENDQEEAELDETRIYQSNGINKEEATEGLSHGESTTEDSSLLKHERDEEPKQDRRDSEGVTVDDDLVQEDTLKTESSIEQTDDDQQDQNQEPKNANENTQCANITNSNDVEVVAEAPTGLQTSVEPHLDESDAVLGTIDEKRETHEPAEVDSVVHPDHNESFQEDPSIDADVVQEDPKSEHIDGPASDAHEVPNQESTEETDGPVEKIEETAHQSKLAAHEETMPEHDTTTKEAPVNIQVQNQESLEEIENAQAVDTEEATQQSSVASEEAIPEDQPNLGITVDDETVQEDTSEAIEQTKDGQQDQDVGPEKASENTEPASMENNPDIAVVAEAPSGVQTPVEINQDNSNAIPDATDGNRETDESAKADGVYSDHKERFPEGTSIAEPTEEVVKVEDQQSQQADVMGENAVKEEVPKSEHADELATNAQELLNQESAEETDGPGNEKNEETEHKSYMEAPKETTPEHDAQPWDLPVNNQMQNKESLEETEDAEVEMRESSAAFEETILEDHATTTEPCFETQHVHHAEPEEINGPGDAEDEEVTNKSNENAIQDNILQSGPTTDIQPVQELEETQSKSAGSYEIDETSDQSHTAVLNDLVQEDATETSEPQMTETEELKYTKGSKAQEFTEQGYVTPSKELSTQDDSKADEPHTDDFPQTLEQDSIEVKETISTSEKDIVEDNVMAEEPTYDSQDVDNADSTEETKRDISENIAEVSDVLIVDKSVEEQNVLGTEDVVETHMQELEPEETKNTEPVESEEHDSKADEPHNDDFPQTPEQDSIEVKETIFISEKETVEDNVMSEEPTCDSQDVDNAESTEETKGNISENIAEVSDVVIVDKSVDEQNVPGTEDVVEMHMRELEPEETKNTEPVESEEHDSKADEPQNDDFPQTLEQDSIEVKETISTSEKDTVKDNVMSEEPTCDSQDVDNAKSTEETKGNIYENIAEVSDVMIVDKSVEEQNVLETEDVVGTHMREVELEETKNKEPVESEEHDSKADEPHNDDFSQTPEQDSIEVKETISTSEKDTVEDNVMAEEPACDSQDVDNAESTKGTKGNISENIAEVSDVVIVDKSVDEQNVLGTEDVVETHMQEVEPEETKNTKPVESEEHDSKADEPHNDDFPQTLEQDSIEVKETISTSEKDTVEDNVMAEEPTCDSQDVDNEESTEETTGNISENIAEISDVVIVDKSVDEQNVLWTEDVVETHMREVEPEETKSTEPVELEEPSDQMNAVLFNDSDQGDNTLESDMQDTESATETTETEAAPQESEACISEEPDRMIESITNCDTQVARTMESLEEIYGDKDMVSASESAQENCVPNSEPTVDIQTLQQQEPEEIKNTEPVEVKETSDEMNTVIFQTLIEEDNPTTVELHESARDLTNIEAAEAGTPHQSGAAQSEEQATEEIETEPQSVEEMNDTEATDSQHISQDSIISTFVESVPEEIATEGNSTIEPEVDHQKLQDQESDFKEIEADKPKENSKPAEITEGPEDVKSNTALTQAAALEEHVETDTTIDTSPVQEPELEETKDAEPARTGDIMTSSDLPVEKMDMETMGTEAVPHESHFESIRELTEDGTESLLELESVEDTKCPDTVEHPGEPHGSTSNEPAPTEENTTITEPAFDKQVQNLTSQEIKDGEEAKTNESSDHTSFPALEEADQESNLTNTDPTPDIQQVQEMGSTEDTRDIEFVGTEEHQKHIVPTLEKPALDSEPHVDDQQVDEDKVAEVKDSEAMEAEEVIQQSNIAIPDDATEERSELRSDPDSYVQLAQQMELSSGSENSHLVRAEETSGQVNVVAIEETPVEDCVASEIDPPVEIKQEHGQEPVEEIKGIDGNEAEEEFHTSQVDAIEKPASEGNIASIEPTSDSKQENELEATKEINIEVINDADQTEKATSEDPSPTDNETTPEGHPTEWNEETMGNETDNVMLVPGIKDETHTSVEVKDDACDLGETIITTQESENATDEDAVQSSGDDILETSKKFDQVKEEQKDGCEQNSSEMSGVQNEESILHVQDRDISGELLAKRGTEEASQALSESDPQGAQDVTEKDDITEGGEQTSDLNRQPDNVALQLQTCEADDLSIGRQDEVVQKVDLDQQQKEDEEIESQKKELQAEEQIHEEKGDDFTKEPIVEPQDIENGTTDRTKDTDACEAEQKEADITEILKHEEAPHVSEESIPSKMAMKVDNVKGTDEGTEEEANAKNDNKDEESAEKDEIAEKDSTGEQDETTDEITNEEDLVAVTQNVESGEHREDKECTDKVNDDVHTIQASEEEITDEIKENEEIKNEENAIHHDELQIKPEEEEAPQLHSNEPCDVDGKIVVTTTLGEEIIDGNANLKPREIEEIGENKDDSASEPLVELSVQNIVEKDLNSHHKVEDEKKNDVDIEGMEEKADESASDINQTKHCQEEVNTDDVQQLEKEEISFDKIDETVSHEKTETSTTEAVPINDNIIDKASGADGGPSDGSIKTFNDTGRDLDASSVITASKEENMNKNMEDHKLALPAHTAHDETTPEQVLCLEKTEREMPSSEKLLPVEPEENQIPDESSEKELQDENQIPNEKNEEDMQDAETGDAQKDVAQDLPVSHFLMNLILGKKNDDANENSESEAERKQGETTEDDSCVLIPKQEESLGSLPTENKVDDNVTLEQEKHDVKCSETEETVKEKNDDLQLDTERSINTDEEFNKNTCDLEIPAYQSNPQDKISGELLSEEAGSISTKMETRDIEISDLELEDKAVDTVCQENTEASTKIENGSLDLPNTKVSEKNTAGEGQTRLQHESLPEDKTADALSEQMPLIESGMIDSKKLSCGAEAVQNHASAKEEEPTESSIIEATSTPDIQLEREEVEKKEEKQHASMATGEVSQDTIESSNDNLQKTTSSEVTSDEQTPQITEPVSDTEKILAHEKETSEGSTCVNEKEHSNFSIEGVENFQTAAEIQADSPNIETNQDKKDEVADNKTAMGPEKLRESDFEDHQETGTEQKSPKATKEGDKHFLIEKETLTKQQVVPGTVESHEETMSIKSNEEQELFDSKVQERDLKVVTPREASEAEENFVDVTKPEFRTDEEQSPKVDEEEKTYDENIKDIDGIKNSTDEVAMKTEAPGATQKAHKKLKLLSGVGSKVKHQLAKVKKAIVGKPGNTKPESPKS